MLVSCPATVQLTALIWCQIGVKVRRLSRFYRFSRLLTTAPSTTYDAVEKLCCDSELWA
jgi:hypothetical protein